MSRTHVELVVIFLAALTVGPTASAASLIQASDAIVVATVEERAVAYQPESVLEASDEAFGGTPGVIGSLTRVRVDEVLKASTPLVAGSRIDIFDPQYAGAEPHWFGIVGQQYVLYLSLPALTTEERRTKNRTAHRGRIGLSTAPVELTDLDATYSVVDPAHGGAVLVSQLPVKLSALRSTVLASTRPVVSITAPSSGATLSGSAQLEASAVDDGGIAAVQFRVDGAPVGPEVSSRPFQYLWRSKDVLNGSHSLTAVARDGSGNSTTSSPVLVTTQNTNAPPTVSGGRTWSAANWGCRTARAIKSDPDGDPLTCWWAIGDGAAGQCRPNCGGCGPNDDTCAGSNDPAVPQESCTISISCTDSWGATDSETWTINRF